MSYAIEALKCEKERCNNDIGDLQCRISDLKYQIWSAESDITERGFRIEHLDAAIATLMAV